MSGAIGADILEAMRHPECWGPWFRDPATWTPWRAFLAVSFGLPMDDGGGRAARIDGLRPRRTVLVAPADQVLSSGKCGLTMYALLRWCRGALDQASDNSPLRSANAEGGLLDRGIHGGSKLGEILSKFTRRIRQFTRSYQ
jgi:hypothetical protein